MSNFANDVEPDWPEDFGPLDEDIVMRPRGPPRNQRYSNAYGDYRGGYGPGEGYGPRPRFFRPGPPGPGPFGPPGPPGPFGPPSRYGPPNLFGPAPTDIMWGRGCRPTDERGLRYLMRCGVPRESLRNLPRDLLQMMESDYCGVCASEFESFASSRAHYLSKNHQKKQGKWLLMRSDADSRRGKEIPMKARELYCELCDVHITSKQHASSHYLGKPHRAIVEGRKQPKNPMLLQGHMRERLDQLIRREKKHMKSDEEQKVAEEPQDNKPPIKELTCVICKISVTCTEQMTIHLNGKKHLTKEKQHILNVMKGPVDDPVAVKTERVDAEDNEGNGEVGGEVVGEVGEEVGEEVGGEVGGAETQEWSENWD